MAKMTQQHTMSQIRALGLSCTVHRGEYRVDYPKHDPRHTPESSYHTDDAVDAVATARFMAAEHVEKLPMVAVRMWLGDLRSHLGSDKFLGLEYRCGTCCKFLGTSLAEEPRCSDHPTAPLRARRKDWMGTTELHAHLDRLADIVGISSESRKL